MPKGNENDMEAALVGPAGLLQVAEDFMRRGTDQVEKTGHELGCGPVWSRVKNMGY
jgi:hypothetical protein